MTNDLRKIVLHQNQGNCDQPHPALKDLSLSGSLEGSTPLLVACEDGHLNAVRLMVESWEADVNRAGVYYREDTKIEGAFPLFVAASRGHDYIVRYLIQKGADVSARTSLKTSIPDYAGMTALHAAVYFLCGDCRMEPCLKQRTIINLLVENGADPSAVTSRGDTMWMLCNLDVSSTFQLVQLGMKLDQCCPVTGRSILHFWAGQAKNRRSLDVVTYLLQKGASLDAVDRECLTPVQMAAVGVEEQYPNLVVLQFFRTLNTINKEDMVAAFELAGAVFVGPSHDTKSVEKGLKLWKLALTLRQANKLRKSSHIITVAVQEFTTEAQLDDMSRNPEECRLQALLVRQRILSKISPNAVMNRQWPSVRSYNYEAIDLLGFGRFLDIHSMMLQASYDPYDYASWMMIIKVARYIVKTLEWLRQKNRTHRYLSDENLSRLVRLVTRSDRHHLSDFKANVIVLDGGKPINHLETVCQLIAIATDMIPDSKDLLRYLKEFVREGGRDANGRTILHIACSSQLTDASSVVRLLWRAGADMNAVDRRNNNPLHLIANKMLRDGDGSEYTTVIFLLQAGTDYNTVNADGRTARDMVDEACRLYNIRHSWVPYLPGKKLSHKRKRSERY